jgi:hypothetical protein
MQAAALRRLFVVGVMLGAAGALLFVLTGALIFIPLPEGLNDASDCDHYA